jgi:asparagine synthase (glutamine-hydrolysing)
MPPSLKLKNGIEKFILKKAFKNRIPQPVIDRPKSGMRVPVHFWFKKELRKYCRSILSRRYVNRAGIFRYERIKRLTDYNIDEGPGRYGLRLWMIMTFEIWRRIVFENEPV